MIVALMAVFGCGEEFTTSSVPEVIVTTSGVFPDSLAQSDSARLAVVVVDPSAHELADVRVVWESSDSGILSIHQDTLPPPGSAYGIAEAGRHATAYAHRSGTAVIRVKIIDGTGIARTSALSGSVTVTARWSAVSAGSYHTCAIDVDSLTYCWGAFAALGTRSAPAYVPVLVSGLEQRRVVALGAGEYITCGKVVEGLLYCWGKNTHGEMGNGTSAPQFTAAIAGGGSTFGLFSVGAHHVCGTGYVFYEVVCWGEDTFGQIGASPGAAPVDCDFLRDFVSNISWATRKCHFTPQGPVLNGGIDFMELSAISAGGSHTCAIDSTTVELLCWGLNTVGQLGLESPGTETCFGFLQEWNDNMQADKFDLACKSVPTVLESGYSLISAGSDEGFEGHSCGVVAGTAYCWGSNDHGQLGTSDHDPAPCQWDGDSTNADPGYAARGSALCIRTPFGGSSPVTTSVLFTAIGAGARSTCGLAQTSGQVYCWGDDTFGELGDGTSGGSRFQPLVIANAARFTNLSVGPHHSCAIRDPDGALFCWGRGVDGQLGTQSPGSATPVRVAEPVR